MLEPVAVGLGALVVLEWRKEPELETDEGSPPTVYTRTKLITK